MSEQSVLVKLLEPFAYEDLEWRIARAFEKDNKVGATCFAYVSARAIQDRLDAILGPANWRVEYEVVAGQKDILGGILCALWLRIDNIWICKEDGSEQTELEPFKGGISGAFKRAAVAWGVGRYLYGLETLWVNICEKSGPGVHFGKTTAKSGQAPKTFYWTPPQLPAWALPKKEQHAEK